jgi:hypothetical protein
VRIDHVIYATADLDAGTARIAGELGFGPAGGGRHDRHGTHNTIFPLGGGYLEVLAVADAGEAVAEPWLPFFIERSADSADPGDGGSAGGISWLEVGGDADRLDGWLGAAILPVRVVGGAERLQAVGIGDRELRWG